MFKSVYLSAALALGLAGCSGYSRLEDTVLHVDINGDGKEDIVRLRRSPGLECEKGYDDNRKVSPGIYILLGLGNSHADGHPVYNICEISVYDASSDSRINPQLGRIDVTDYNKDGKLDIIYTPNTKTLPTVAFLDKYGDSMFWNAKIVKQQ